MKIPTPQYRCPLGRLQPDVQDVDVIKQRGWRDQHILVVNADDERLDWMERKPAPVLGRVRSPPSQKQRIGGN